MKKTFIMLSALLMLICGFVFTGCQHSYVADEATWYSTTATISGESVKLWFYYSTDKITVDGKNYDPGLTILAVPGIKGTALYCPIHFNSSNTEQEVTDNTDPDQSSVKIKANGTFMDGLYIKFKSDFTSSATKSFPLDNNYTSVDSISNLGEKYKDMGWKTILKEIVNSI